MNKIRRILSILLVFVMVFSLSASNAYAEGNEGEGTNNEYVAQIGDVKYATLEDAFATAVDGDTITLLKDSSGNGIKVPESMFTKNGLTVDFNNHTYTVDGSLVGSTGTETQAFQLLQNNNITFWGALSLLKMQSF